MEQRRTALAVVASLGALLLAAPRPPAAVALLSGTAGAADPTGPVVAAVALLAWAATGWLALTVVLVLLSRTPGLAGRTVQVLARRTAPAAVRRAVEAALGLTVAVGVLAPTAAVAAPAAAPVTAPVTAPSAPAGPRGDAGWDLDWPAARPPALTGPTVTPSARPPAPAAPRAPAAAPTRPTAVPPAPSAVVVVSGDSLWSVAEAALRRAGTGRPTDRQVAQAWPRWWAANRETVGDDPDLLLPGTVLRPPPGAAGQD